MTDRQPEIDALKSLNSDLYRVIGEQNDKIDALKAENEKLRKDAERYRWLRDPCVDIRPIVKYQRGDFGSAFLTHQSLDKAIDAAMTPSPDTKGE